MLGQAPGLSHIKSESSIRHEVRKLRAKVKSLVPIDKCNKYEKRNNRIAKIQKIQLAQKKQKEQKHSGKEWKITTGFNLSEPLIISKKKLMDENQVKKQYQGKILKKIGISHNKFKNMYFRRNQQIPEQTCKHDECYDHLNRYEFEKLTSSEIDKINQDRIYYLGEENIQAFNDFLIKRRQNRQGKSEFGHMVKTKHSSSLYNLRKDKEIIRKQQKFQKSKDQISLKMWNSQKNLRATSQLAKRNRISFQMQHNYNIQQKAPIYEISEDILTRTDSVNRNEFRNFKNLQQRKLFIQDKINEDIDYHKTRLKERENKSENNYRQICYNKYSKLKKNSVVVSKKINKALEKKGCMFQNHGDIQSINQIIRKKIIEKKSRKNVQNCYQNSQQRSQSKIQIELKQNIETS